MDDPEWPYHDLYVIKRIIFKLQASSLDMDRVEQVEKENAELKKQLALILKR